MHNIYWQGKMSMPFWSECLVDSVSLDAIIIQLQNTVRITFTAQIGCWQSVRTKNWNQQVIQFGPAGKFDFVCRVNPEAHARPQTHCPKLDKLCRSEVIGLRIVETDTRHCPGHLASSDLVKLRDRLGPSFVKKRLGDDRGWRSPGESAFVLLILACASERILLF